MKRMMKLPIGIENFEEIRTEGFYYVDKTGLIKELLDSSGKVTLFTRPRRFGKSLNMNMLQYFLNMAAMSGCLKDWKSAESRNTANSTWGNSLWSRSP